MRTSTNPFVMVHYLTRPKTPDFRLREFEKPPVLSIEGFMSMRLRTAELKIIELYSNPEVSEMLIASFGDIHYNIFITLWELILNSPRDASQENLDSIWEMLDHYSEFLDGARRFPSLPPNPESLWFFKYCDIDPGDLQ